MRARVEGVLLGVVMLLCCALPVEAQGTVVVVVRHAETAEGPEGDPVLSPRGMQRAQALADALKDADVAAVFTTHYARTRQTAEPLTAVKGVAAHALTATPTHIAETAERVRREYAGRTVVIVGHGNTVPQLIEALGGPPVPAISHDEYDRLYILTIDGEHVRTVSTTYGP